jgi:hypothetical protein
MSPYGEKLEPHRKQHNALAPFNSKKVILKGWLHNPLVKLQDHCSSLSASNSYPNAQPIGDKEIRYQ